MSRKQRYLLLELLVVTCIIGLIIAMPGLIWGLAIVALCALVTWLVIKALQWADRGDS